MCVCVLYKFENSLLKGYSTCFMQELQQLADELRSDLIFNVSKTGGHLGSGLGVIELTVALHFVFNAPQDRILWDVGHQVMLMIPWHTKLCSFLKIAVVIFFVVILCAAVLSSQDLNWTKGQNANFETERWPFWFY